MSNLTHPISSTNVSPGDIALAELRVKSLQDVQRDTALRWMGRARAAMAIGLDAVTVEELAHEALEHAGNAGGAGDDTTLAVVRQGLTLQGPVSTQAVEEMQHKTLTDIQRETAFTWAWRAYAAYHLGRPDDAIVFALEAVEHAVLTNDNGVLATVRKIIADAKAWWDANATARR